MQAFYIIAFIAVAITQIIFGLAGADHYFSWWGALIVAFLAFGLRFTLPLTVFCFLGAMNVFDWHWFFALLLAVPGLLFVVPGMLAAGIDKVRGR